MTNKINEHTVIGVVGVGFVGNAVVNHMRRHFCVETYDINPEKSTCSSMREFVCKSHIIFVCVPSPMKPTGECDTSIVRQVLFDINAWSAYLRVKKDVVLKSTVPPGTSDDIGGNYTNVIFNPEFLTEANAEQDFTRQTHIVLGGENLTLIKEVYKESHPQAQISCVSRKEAEMVKYVANCFLAVKVAFSNEIWQLCQKLGILHENVVEAIKKDERLGKTHWQVPGPDGHFGFGGTCFPKDMESMLWTMQKSGMVSHVVAGALLKNDEVRPERDWEQLKGRAVSE
jgi:UDPglucose 6-dehydrogenase